MAAEGSCDSHLQLATGTVGKHESPLDNLENLGKNKAVTLVTRGASSK